MHIILCILYYVLFSSVKNIWAWTAKTQQSTTCCKMNANILKLRGSETVQKSLKAV